MRKALALVAAWLLVMVPARADSHEEPMDEERACPAEEVPHTASPVLTDDDGKTVTLSVAMVLDGVDRGRASRVIQRSAGAYAQLGVRVVVSSWTATSLRAGGKNGDGQPTIDSEAAIRGARAAVGGSRPAGADVVYLATSKDLTSPQLGEAVAGQADCIGGVERPTRAFAVGEIRDRAPAHEVGPVTLDAHIPAKVLAHEIGHLLGAHHHHANCAEGTTTADVSGDTAPCTLMFNLANLQGLGFGAVETAIVRGHASDYARP